MEDGEQNKNVERSSEGECISDSTDDGDVFQSIWIRHSSIFSDLFDRKFMERQLRTIFYIGSFFWILFFITKIL